MDTQTTKVAIVTGAGSGIGRETAVLLAQAGYALVLVGRTRATLEETEKLAGNAGAGEHRPSNIADRIGIVVEDVAEAEAPARVIAAAVARFGRVDAVANVAGTAPLQPIEEITPAIWRQNIDVNLSAPVLMTAAVWSVFREQGSGVIVNVSSMSSIDPFPGFSIYGAAKVGLNLFTRCTAEEGAKIGVRAVAIAPGAVETAMLRQHFDQQVIPAAQAMSPTAVAQVIVDCVTGARAFEPGETIVLAG